MVKHKIVKRDGNEEFGATFHCFLRQDPLNLVLYPSTFERMARTKKQYTIVFLNTLTHCSMETHAGNGRYRKEETLDSMPVQRSVDTLRHLLVRATIADKHGIVIERHLRIDQFMWQYVQHFRQTAKQRSGGQTTMFYVSNLS